MPRGSIHSPGKTIVPVLLLTTALAFSIGDARAGDAERGKLLYENHCKECHTSVVHLREDRKAGSQEEIRTWVQRWSRELGLQWGSEKGEALIFRLLVEK